MKTQLLALDRENLERFFWRFFPYSNVCGTFISHVPKRVIVQMIIDEIKPEVIKSYYHLRYV